jgi:hypothetical protein
LKTKGEAVMTSPIFKPNTMQISLDNHEQEIVRGIALARHNSNIDRGSRSYKMGNGDDLLINLEGIAAEFAFCKLKNIYPDMTIDHPIPFDCYLNGHGFIDVKSTKKPNGMLLVGTWKYRSVPAYYALMVGEFPNYEFKGYFPGAEVFKDENLVDLGHGPTYGISQDRLKMEL